MGLTAGTSRWRVGGRRPRQIAPRQIAAVLAIGTAVIGGAPGAPAQSENVCDRTVQVRNAIEAASGAEGCAGLTLDHLREITTLDLREQGISGLRAGDFDGLVRLETLDLSGNALTSLPSGVFDELYLLKTLRLDGNLLETLPGGIFDELFLLEELTLHENRFTSLPDGLFEEFSRFDGMQADGIQPDNSGAYPRIRRFLDRHDVSSPEEFIAALPSLYLQRFVLMYESESPAQPHVSGEHPRVISWGADGDFIFSWNTDPDAPAMFRESVEFLRQDEFAWSVGVIDFSGATPEITEPASCQSCHGSMGKPLWKDWGFWAGTEYPALASLEGYSPAAAGDIYQIMDSSDPRLDPLDFSASSFAGDGARVLSRPDQPPYAVVTEEAGAVWSWRHSEVLFRALRQRREDFDRLAEAVMCGDIREIWGHDFPVLHTFHPDEHHLHFSAETELSVRPNGQLLLPGLASRTMGYFYLYPGSIPGAVNFLLLADLWERDEMVRHLYRRTGNEETVRSGDHAAYALLHYPSGSATAEDELIQKLRIHFGRGGRTALEVRDRQNRRYFMGGILSSRVWEGHAEVMKLRVCSAIRESRPRDLNTSVSGGNVELRWEAPTYDQDVLSGYRILRSAGGSDAEVLVADTGSSGTTWTDENPAAGVYDYTVRALYDGLYASRSSEEARATVGDTAGTAAPSVDEPRTHTVLEGETAIATLAATDEDTSAGELTWSVAGGADQGSFTLSSAGVLAFASARDYESPDDVGGDGTYALTVQVSDGKQSGTADLSVTLSNRNEAPSANAGADQDGIEGGATVSLSGTGTDPDADDTLSYGWTQTAGTTVALSAADAAATSFTAPSDLSADETLRFTLRVTDAGGLYAEDEVAVAVEAAATAAPAVTGATTFTVMEGETTVGGLTATDEDTSAGGLIWSISGGADQGSFALGSAGTLAFASAKDYESPDDADSDGTYEVTVQVSDGGQSGTAAVRVTLSNRNEAPTANAGADQDGIEGGATVNLRGSGTDPDADDSLSYAWTQTTGTTATLSSAAAAAASVTAPSDLSADETLRFTLRVTDGGGLHAEDEVAITVEAAATAAPAVTGATTFAVMEGETAVAVLTAVDEDTTADDLTWSLSGGADQAGFTLSSAGVLAFASPKDYESPDDVGGDGTYALTVQVSDGNQSGTADLRVTLANRNEAPAANAGADQDGIAGGATVSLSGTGTDPDADDTLSYGWTQTAGATVALSAADAAATSFTAPSELSADETLRFTLRVTDADGLYAEDEVVVAVETAATAPLTARVERLPARHDGNSRFTFELHFSEEVNLSYMTVRDSAFEVTAGAVVNARRQSPPSNRSWYIRVEPTSDAGVELVLPAGRACDVTGAICTADGRRLSNRLDLTVAGPPPAPLTAWAERVPDSHDGTTFRFRLRFSAEIDIGYVSLRDNSFDVTGGSITYVQRLARPSNRDWEITVAPDSNANVVLVLAADRACGAAGAICTAGGARLSNRLEITVPAQP